MDERRRSRCALMQTLLRLAGPNGHAGGITSTGEGWTVTSKTIDRRDSAPVWLTPSWSVPPNAPTQQGFGHFDRIAQKVKQG